MENAGLAEKPPLGDFFGNRRSRRRKSAASRYRIKEKLRSGRRCASGPHVDYNARLYDPGLGRFLSVDPVIGHPGSTQSINPYSYVENNPLNKTDPTGQSDVCAGQQNICNVSTKDVQSVSANDNGSVTVTKTDGTTVTSAAGTLGAGTIANMALGAVSKFGTSSVNFGNLDKMIKGLDASAASDHTKISPKRQKAADMAALSACSYSSSCKTMGNYHRTTDGISSDKFIDDNTGFKAALFENGNSGAYVLAFAGTDSLTAGPDREASELQMEGRFSPQFAEARTLTGLAKAATDGNLTLTGHSLGGGLATLGALAYGLRATVFNSEWLSAGTIARYHLNTSNSYTQITAYHTEFDPLTAGQEAWDEYHSISDPNYLVPLGRQIEIPGVHFHGISGVCEGLGTTC